MRVAVGADHAGYELKQRLVAWLRTQGHDVEDLGTDSTAPVDYPDYAEAVSRAVLEARADRGLVVCGSGVGAAIAANKLPGIRAGLCHDTYSAERARKSNDAQVITMGARVIGSELAKAIIETWLNAEFAGGRSAPKVEKMNAVDEKYRHQ